jgi:hypothetical protein
MYLAVIFGLCTLMPAPAGAAMVIQDQSVPRVQETPARQDVPPPESQKSSQENPPAGPAEPSQPGGEKTTEPATPSQAPAAGAASPGSSEKASAAEGKTEPAVKAAKPRHRRRKHAAASKTNSAPEKKVVRNGGTGDPVVQLAPGMSQEQASSQRQSTSQMLASTETNLKQVSLQKPDAGQQDSVKQIRKYMEQAQAAEKAGDVQRAKNLASKALLLSEDLAKK